GPLPEPISAAVNENDLVVASVLSGNRNFEGRIHPDCRANYLASPPLVVAYALAGTVNIDLTREPLGQGKDGKPVYLRDIWPSQQAIAEVVARSVGRDQFVEQYANVFEGAEEWKAVEVSGSGRYQWDDQSTYIQEPPFFADLTPEPKPVESVSGARCLVKVGDSATTDHISPAGAIKKESPAGEYLIGRGVPVSMFNSYGSRRGNHEVMLRGTFANIRVRNQLAPGTEGGWTTYWDKGTKGQRDKGTEGEGMTVYDAAMKYKEAGVPLVVLAGKDYGMGSSRDWAAKGTYLLGIKAVIAESFERIHRSNLVGMGVLPLAFEAAQSAEKLGLDGTEVYDIDVPVDLKPRQTIKVKATRDDGSAVEFKTTCRVDTPVEAEYYRNGGILHTVLRKMAKGEESGVRS
ncbi:MAG: aconitase family protein, partial [Planctomycetota bacterium]